MHQKLAQDILQQVKNNYNICAREFSLTRSYNWEEIKNLSLKYVKDGMKILDVGCGNGRSYELLKNKNVNYIGIDNSEELIEEAKNKFNVNFTVGDILNIPFSDNSFDILFCIAVMHHIPSKELREKSISEMRRVLKPEGVLIMSNWNLYQKKYLKYLYKFTINKLLLKNKMDFGDIMLKPFSGKGSPRYHHAFTKTGIEILLKNKNFKIVESFYSRKANFMNGANLISVGKKI